MRSIPFEEHLEKLLIGSGARFVKLRKSIQSMLASLVSHLVGHEGDVKWLLEVLKVMHLSEADDDLAVGDFVDDAIDLLCYSLTLVASLRLRRALVHTNDVTW